MLLKKKHIVQITEIFCQSIFTWNLKFLHCLKTEIVQMNKSTAPKMAINSSFVTSIFSKIDFT